MRITNLEPEKYKRLFTFGCSFTKYIWPTWADIIGQDIEFYENWGRQGAGNHYIFNSIMECDQRYNFDKNDLILIMWSNTEREDRYLDHDWLCASIGNKEKIYGRGWVKKFGVDRRGYLIRDLAYIKSIQNFLISKNLDWINFTMYSVCSIDENKIIKDGYTYEKDLAMFVERYLQLNRDLCDGKPIKESYVCDQDVLELYSDVYDNLEYSILDVVRNGYAFCNRLANFNDEHCTPLEHLNYLDKLYPNNTLSKKARNFANHWEEIVWNIKEKNKMPTPFIHPRINRL